MRRLLSLLVLAAAVAAATGCSCKSQLRTQAEGFEASVQEVFREYEAIVIEGKPRPNYTEGDKTIRRNSIRKFKELVEQARKE